MSKKILNILKLSLIVIITVYYSIAVIIAMKIKGSNIFYKYAKSWSKLLLKVAGVNLKINNLSSIEDNKSYIYISNHSSLFDIPILLSVLNLRTRIMYKEELEKIPLFGYCLKLSPFISVKRENKENARASFNSSLQAINQSDSVIIFPEGTRSEDGKLGEFKKGAFLLALKSNKDLIPITIIGSNKILPKGKKNINSTTVEVYIHNNIKPDVNNLNLKDLIESVHKIIDSKLNN